MKRNGLRKRRTGKSAHIEELLMSTSVSVGHRPQRAPGRRPSIRRLAGLLGLTVAIGLGCVETVSAQQDPFCLLYTSPSPRDATLSRMPSSA